jgi:hypothetical protein
MLGNTYYTLRVNIKTNEIPILYKYKYFRSKTEAAKYFKIDTSTINYAIRTNRLGCMILDPKKEYNFEARVML